jgi:hypothetical protein
VLLNKVANEDPNLSDFRPISLLSTIAFKGLEIALLKRTILWENVFNFGFKMMNSTSCMMWTFEESLNHCKTLYDGIGL